MAKAKFPEAWAYKNPDEKPKGKFHWDELLGEARLGNLKPGCLVWHEQKTSSQWVPAENYSVLKAYITPEGRAKYEKLLDKFPAFDHRRKPVEAEPPPEAWLYRIKGGDHSTFGYFTDSEALIEASEGRLTDQCEVWHAKHTYGGWRDASKVRAFKERFEAGERFLSKLKETEEAKKAIRVARIREDQEKAAAFLRERSDGAANNADAKAAEGPRTSAALLVSIWPVASLTSGVVFWLIYMSASTLSLQYFIYPALLLIFAGAAGITSNYIRKHRKKSVSRSARN